jgi:hypothetical protein
MGKYLTKFIGWRPSFLSQNSFWILIPGTRVSQVLVINPNKMEWVGRWIRHRATTTMLVVA